MHVGIFRIIFIIIMFRSRILIVVFISSLFAGCSFGDWRTASREPAGIAPDPESTPEAVIHVYTAPTFGWRGYFAVHTWISMKRSNEGQYTVYEVIGWRKRSNLPVLRIEKDEPDRYWYGERPTLILEKRGEGVDKLITEIDDAARRYPWKDTYNIFPGPNSNTFPAWIAKQVPELELTLPITAIGKGWDG